VRALGRVLPVAGDGVRQAASCISSRSAADSAGDLVTALEARRPRQCLEEGRAGPRICPIEARTFFHFHFRNKLLELSSAMLDIL
jgi:hypothetical protein